MPTTIFIKIMCFSLMLHNEHNCHHRQRWGWPTRKHWAWRWLRSQLLHVWHRILDICPSCSWTWLYPRRHGHREQRSQAARPLLHQHAPCQLCNDHQPPPGHPQQNCQQLTTPCLCTCMLYPSPYWVWCPHLVNHPMGLGGQGHNPENPWQTTSRSSTHPINNALCRNPKLPSTHTTCGQLPTLTMHASSTMMPFAAILQASEASSNPSRIPLLPNMFVRPWHWAPHASTFRWQTSGTIWLILPLSPLRILQCPGIVTSSYKDALLQTLLALRTGSSRRLMSPLLHTTPHNIYSHNYTCPCSMFAPVICFTPSHHPLTKLIWQWLLQNDSAGTGNRECKPNDFWEPVYCLLTPKP